jgi:hypothetical protein
MTNFIIVRSDVREYSDWLPLYTAHLPVRAAAGLVDKQVFQDVEDPNKVTIIFEAEDLDRAKEFIDSAEIKETMQEHGVLGKPDIYFLKG